ncbi:hypothetical protein PS15m_005533 [Mucor circinelloides]
MFYCILRRSGLEEEVIHQVLIKKNINNILKYKKEENCGLSLKRSHFIVKKADDVQKRKRDEIEEDGLVADNNLVTITGQIGTLDDQLTAELYTNDLEDNVDESAVIEYEKEEELKDLLSATAKSVVEDVDEMEALIPVLEEKYNLLTVSDDSDQQQRYRASILFDLRKYSTFFLLCFDKKKRYCSSHWR